MVQLFGQVTITTVQDIVLTEGVLGRHCGEGACLRLGLKLICTVLIAVWLEVGQSKEVILQFFAQAACGAVVEATI